MHQKTNEKKEEKEDRTFRNHFENESPDITMSGFTQNLDRSIASVSQGSDQTTDPIRPIVYLNVNLDSKSVTAGDKKFEFAKGVPRYELVISRNGGKKVSTYNPDTQQTTGPALSVGDYLILAELTSKVTNTYLLAVGDIYKTRKEGGLELKDAKCEYAFPAARNLSSTHRAFIKEVTIPMYLKMRSSYSSTFDKETVQKNVWNVQGAVFVSTQAAVEAGYGSESAFKKAKDNGNFWGIGGVNNFVNTGAKTSEEGFAYWLDYISKGYKKKKGDKEYRDGTGWQEAVKLFETGDFTADQMNKAFRSGRHKGTYPYNSDPNSNDTYYSDPEKKTKSSYLNYAGKIISDDMMKPFILRFAEVLQEEITALATDTSKEGKYKSALYEAIRCELGDFLQNDYPALLKSKNEYK